MSDTIKTICRCCEIEGDCIDGLCQCCYIYVQHQTKQLQAENADLKQKNEELLVLCGKAAEELRLHVFNREDPACEIVLEIRQIIANEKEKQ